MQVNGAAIRKFRRLIGVNGAEFARRCVISPQHLSDIELGRRNPSPAVTKRMCVELDCTFDEISARPTAEAVA